MKKTILLFLIVLLLLSSCTGTLNKNGENLTEATTAGQTLKPPDAAVNKLFGIGYCLNKDGFLNPLLEHAELNTALFSLMFDGLFKLNENFAPRKVLCESITHDGAEVTLNIKSGVLFHDGSKLTAADVVYSLNMAKNNENSAYARRLSVILEISEVGDYTVKLTLSSTRKSVASLLDIPIIKKNTGLTSNAVGCGRYMITENDEILYLSPFSSYHEGPGENIALSHILLTEIKDNDVLEYGVLSGNIDIIKVDLLPENEVYVYANADRYPVATNSFIFLGLNTKYGALSNKNLRQAVSLLIDKDKLRTETLCGHVKQAWGIYPACLYKDTPLPEEITDANLAHSLISSAGYTLSGGIFKSFNGENLKISLLINENYGITKAAEQISEMLKAGGIETEIKTLSKNSYQTSLKNADFDIYIGQVDISPDFDFTFLLGSGGAANYSGYYQGAINTHLANFALFGIESSKANAQSISEIVAGDVPIIPIGYKTEYIFLSREYGIANVKVTRTDPFYNVFEWKMSQTAFSQLKGGKRVD